MLCCVMAADAQQQKDSITVQPKAAPVREFTREVAAPGGSVFRIINTQYNLELRTWDEKKVRIVTTISLANVPDTFDNDGLYALSNINLKSFGKLVELESIAYPSYPGLNHLDEIVVQGYPSKKRKQASATTQPPKEGADEITVNGYRIRRDSVPGKSPEPIVVQGYPTPQRRKAVVAGKDAGLQDSIPIYRNQPVNKVQGIYLPENGASENSWTRTANSYRKMIVYLPKDCQLLVHNRNTDITVNDDLDNADFNLATTNLGTRGIRHLKVEAKLFNIYTGDVRKADLDLSSGSLIAGTIGYAAIRSSQAEIDYDGGDTLVLRSQSDRINVEEIGRVSGTKNFGNLRVGKLAASMDIEGRNSNIKVRRIAPEVTSVKINTRYADLRLPLRQLTGFRIEFNGDNSAVYSGFRPEATDSNGKKIIPSTEILDQKVPASFTLETGNGKRTSLVITCPNCTVDFK